MLLATSTVTLATHSMLAWAQSAGLLRGDYGEHLHGFVTPIALAGLTAGAAALFLYGVHLVDLDTCSVPLLARAFRARLGWQAVGVTALCASLALVGMETGEQLAARHFDGFSSAFSGAPAVGLGLILLFSAAASAALRALCAWLADAHTRIVFAIMFLRRHCGKDTAPALAGSWRASLAAVCYVCDASHVYGKRAPPVPR
jgi:transposase